MDTEDKSKLPPEPPEPPIDSPEVDEISIEVYVQDGTISAVTMNGAQVRAMVLNFDVEFPCPAINLERTEDGTYYQRFVV